MLVSYTEETLHSNLLFLLADVMETLMSDVNELLKKKGKCLKHEAKRDFNAALANIKKMRKSSINNSCMETQVNYANDSDQFYQMIKLIIDRSGRDDRAFHEIYKMIEKKESKLQMETLDSSVFDSIEFEEERKSKKHIRIACKVFGIDNIHKKFCKDAYHARMLVANSLKSEGFRNEVIAKKLGITKRTAKRLINLCDGELEKDLKFMVLSKKFIDEYFEEKELDKDIA